ncbi:hypothetical protein O181_087194 [Austropuccinia psidii MF-1]|uniref:Uncharacterized protein n=1 Tax=Austropuccinia psidii MF-1 TaxID=1389203 RepID=A0A9Q3IPB0_9BASI|nr:hypothetical protein [Austropuccinia psidii MF-1]
MANLAIFSILSHLSPYGLEWRFCHILHHWSPLPILNPTNPQANPLILGLGAPYILYGLRDQLGKKGLRGNISSPNAKWTHLSLFLAKSPGDPKNLKLAIIDHSTQDCNHDLWESQRPPFTFIKGFPLKISETPGPTQWIQAFRNQVWCI